LRVAFAFGDPRSGVRDIALHLPAGLTANPRAIPFCSRRRLLADLCSPRSKAGSLTITVQAFGFDLPVTRNIYNARPSATERVRLAVPIYGTLSRPGVAAELPITERPGDKGLDLRITGLPSEVGGIPVRIKEVGFRIKGVSRRRVKRRSRKRPFLTNPLLCAPATSVLEVTAQDAPTTTITASSAFTPLGCAGPR
jgi:hypothetical protein